MSKLVKTILLLAIIAIVSVGIFKYRQSSHLHKNGSQAKVSIAIETAQATTRPVPKYIDTVAVLEAKHSSNISPDIAGKITAILFKPGQYVEKNQPLIKLDDRVYRARLKSAEAQLAFATQNYRRNKKLAPSGAQAKQDLDLARSQFLQAQADVSSNQTYLEQTTIIAPFAGHIGALQTHIGDYVQVGEALTVLINQSDLQIKYQLAEKYLPKLKVGQSITVSSDDHKHLSFNGKVSYIAPNVDITTHSITLFADIDNKNNALTPGLFLKVRQTIAIDKNAVLVPLASVVPTISGNLIYKVVQGKAQAVQVKLGSTLNEKIEVKKGIKVGDKVIIAGQNQVKQGSAVHEVNTP